MIHHDPPALFEFAKGEGKFAVRILVPSILWPPWLTVDQFVKAFNYKFEVVHGRLSDLSTEAPVERVRIWLIFTQDRLGKS